jgi:hypothetical protein
MVAEGEFLVHEQVGKAGILSSCTEGDGVHTFIVWAFFQALYIWPPGERCQTPPVQLGRPSSAVPSPSLSRWAATSTASPPPACASWRPQGGWW